MDTRQPERLIRVQVLLRPEIYRRLLALAERERRGLPDQTGFMIERALSRQAKREPAPLPPIVAANLEVHRHERTTQT